jgi:hypothetical protein
MAWYDDPVAHVTKYTAANYKAMVAVILGHKTRHSTGGDDALTASDIGASASNHTHTTLPSSDEKAALAGTSGTAVSASNKLVDNSDTRLSDTRDPKSHSHAASDVTGTAVVDNDARLTDDRTPKAHNLVDTTGHPVSGLTTGHFMKATGADTYGFAAHGLTASDVGASASDHTHDYSGTYLGLSAKAADADKLDNHDSTYFQTAITTSRRFLSILQAVVPITNGATIDQYESSTNKINQDYALFPAASTKYLQWKIGLDDWNTTTIKVEPVFDSESANSGNVVFTFDALRLPDGGTIDSAWGTAVSSDDTYQGAGKQHIGPQTANITPAGASGAEIVLRITRGTDTLDGDVRLTGIWVEWPVTRT